MTETRITPIDYVRSTEPSLKTAVTVVIPCFNESAGIEFLANRLREISDQYRDQHEFFFILVDDGSSDTGPDVAKRLAEERDYCVLLGFRRNFGKPTRLSARRPLSVRLCPHSVAQKPRLARYGHGPVAGLLP